MLCFLMMICLRIDSSGPLVPLQSNNMLFVMGCFGYEQFLFYFILFSDFIGILFSFSFLLDDEEVHDTAVT